MILLEGCDGSGKSTLAEALQAKLGWEVWHSGAPDKPYLEMWLKPVVEHPHQDLILDRWHLGDLVYGPAWRGKTLSDQEFMVIEMALQVRGASLIHVYVSPEQAAQVLVVRGDDLVSPNDVASHIYAFREAVERSILPTIHWSHERLELIPLEEILITHRRADEYRAAFPHMPGIGNLLPKWIFVGEQPNSLRVDEAYDIPFAVGSSGEWLFQAFSELDLLGDVYLTNAIKKDGDRESIAQEIRWLQRWGKPKVVALGTQAAELLEYHRIVHHLANHPAYARRFKFSENYSEHLAKAMNYVA